jgi:hypothetical protein
MKKIITPRESGKKQWHKSFTTGTLKEKKLTRKQIIESRKRAEKDARLVQMF